MSFVTGFSRGSKEHLLEGKTFITLATFPGTSKPHARKLDLLLYRADG